MTRQRIQFGRTSGGIRVRERGEKMKNLRIALVYFLCACVLLASAAALADGEDAPTNEDAKHYSQQKENEIAKGSEVGASANDVDSPGQDREVGTKGGDAEQKAAGGAGTPPRAEAPKSGGADDYKSSYDDEKRLGQEQMDRERAKDPGMIGGFSGGSNQLLYAPNATRDENGRLQPGDDLRGPTPQDTGKFSDMTKAGKLPPGVASTLKGIGGSSSMSDLFDYLRDGNVREKRLEPLMPYGLSESKRDAYAQSKDGNGLAVRLQDLDTPEKQLRGLQGNLQRGLQDLPPAARDAFGKYERENYKGAKAEDPSKRSLEEIAQDIGRMSNLYNQYGGRRAPEAAPYNPPLRQSSQSSVFDRTIPLVVEQDRATGSMTMGELKENGTVTPFAKGESGSYANTGASYTQCVGAGCTYVINTPSGSSTPSTVNILHGNELGNIVGGSSAVGTLRPAGQTSKSNLYIVDGESVGNQNLRAPGRFKRPISQPSDWQEALRHLWDNQGIR